MLRAMVEARASDERAHAEREAARLAEIRALRYQINPHFLFNCLNSLTALVRRTDVSQAEQMIGDLGQFIRFSLAVDPVADVSLDSEVEMQLRYLALERRRFPTRMKVDVQMDPDVADAALPSLILQPLVENAVKHGVDARELPVEISLKAGLVAPDTISITITNHVVGPSAVAPCAATPGFGIGLQNVAARLAARFGDAATLAAGPVDHGTYRAELRIPFVPMSGR
jgi:two-component system, LytTR family, sensor kinase